MKISYRWLQDYLTIVLSPHELAELLTDIGLEVESLTEIESIKGGLRGVVIGEVLTCEPHPNADRLKITTVQVGEEEPLPIVCGAPNVAAGQKVLVATVGSTLYPADKPLTIKKSKIRGEVSQGMICAEDELGLGSNHDGIMVLDDAAPIGVPAAGYFKLESDHVFEIGLTPNRSDAMCHYGVARDIKAALAVRHEERLKLNRPGISTFYVQHRDRPVEVSIENKEACLRYAGVSLKGLQVGPSPKWLQQRLRSIGLSPLNNVVDITNFVLHETGHPLHAFDLKKIGGQHIYVKNLPEGTTFTTLDGKERKLSQEDLMICDAEKPLVLAGIFGGLNSGVDEDTTEVFLESAVFDPVSIRKSARRHGLSTDASFRYERGIDPDMTLYALKRAALLIQQVAGGEISMNIRDNVVEKVEPHAVTLHLAKVHEAIGQEIAVKTIKKILQELEIRITAESGQDLYLQVPSYRHDVSRPADLIEEILRIYGFNQIDITGPMRISIAHETPRSRESYREMATQSLIARGFHEIMNNSLTKGTYYEKFDFDPKYSVTIVNPLSQDLSVMRQNLLWGGLETIRHNSRRQRPELRLLEFGRVYRHLPKGYQETEHLALWITGPDQPESWRHATVESDFYSIKGEVSQLLHVLGIKQWQEHPYHSALYSSALQMEIHGKKLVTLGKLAPAVCQVLELKQAVYYADMDWDGLYQAAAAQIIRYEDLPKFPEVRRDLALLLDASIPYADLQKAAFKVEKKLLKQVNLFDVYEGKNVPEGKKSYALSFILQDQKTTLKDARVDQVMNKIKEHFAQEFSAQLR